MIDKEKIRNIIELFIAWNGETEPIDVANLDSAVEFIDSSLQEEPKSEVWHTMDEEPPQDSNICLLWPKDNIITIGKLNGLKDFRYVSKWAYAESILNLKEESVSEDLGEYINELSKQFPEVSFAKLSRIAVRVAKWQKEQFEKNRLKHCDSITEEQYNLEQGFIDQHLDKNNRMPTFLDAIEYGYLKAEKDLELTWEDMFDIFRLVNVVLDDYADGKTRKEVGEEVLKRFKERKGE